MVMLRGPHLVLANFSRDVSVTVLCQLVEALDRILRFDLLFLLLIREAFAITPLIDLCPPLAEIIARMLFAAPAFEKRIDGFACVGDNRNVNANRLVDRRRINIDVDLLRVWRERIEATCHAVIKACAKADHNVTIMHGMVCFIGTVHANHAEPVAT